MTEEGRYIPDEIPAHFWLTIDRAKSDPIKLRNILSDMSSDEIIKFYWNYEEAVAQIKSLYYDLSTLSESSIDEICYWIVAQGETEYRMLWDNAEELITDESSPMSKLKSDPGLVSQIYESYESRFKKGLPVKTDEVFHE